MDKAQFQIQLENRIEGLLSLLHSMLESYQRLLNFILNEREFLIASDTEKLILNNQAKETTLLSLTKMEEERLALIELLRRDLNEVSLSGSELRLKELSCIFEQKNFHSQASALRKIHEQLIKIIAEVRLQNSENSVYAESGIQSLNGAIESIKEIFAGSKTYEKKGQYRSRNRQSGNFVRKEI